MKTLLFALLSLVSLGFAEVAAEKTDATKNVAAIICSVRWKWDHPLAKGRDLKFTKDGLCESNIWKGGWKVTGSNEVEIIMPANRKMLILFNKDYSGFTAKHPDGGEVTGRRLGDLPSTISIR